MASLSASELEYLTWIEAELKRSSAIREETKKLTGGEAQVRVQEAWSSIASKGLSGYSATDIATLKTDLGISGELGIE